MNGDHAAMRDSLLKIAVEAFDAEQERLVESARNIIETQRAALETQINERLEGLENFISGLSDRDETDTRKPIELVDDLGLAIGIPVRLNNDQIKLLGNDPEKLKEPLENQIVNLFTGLTITRLIMAFERRLEDNLPVKAADFQNKDWSTVADELMNQVEELFKRNRARLFGENGQILRDINSAIDRLNRPPVDENLAIQLMEVMSRGARMVFDKRTHKQTWMPTTRLRYMYLASNLLKDATAANITGDVLEHFTGATEALKEMWGVSEWSRFQQMNLLPGEAFTKRFIPEVGEEEAARLMQLPLGEWPEEGKEAARLVIGEQVMNEINRHLLLSVISELWVEYLTRVESLRVSIGLEAYAQRDPLVAYKSKASELFSNLLRDIRAGVIMRAFNYRPRQAVQTVEGDATAAPLQTVEAVAQPAEEVSKGRKRHRH
jgi:preprotein translocase subunit SecA